MLKTVRNTLERRSTVYEQALATVEDGLFIVLDDTRTGSVFDFSREHQATGEWKVNPDTRWAGGTETAFGEGEPDGALGALVMITEGTQVSFVGRAPATSAGHKVTVEVDSEEGKDFDLQDTPEASTSSSSSSYRAWLTVDLPDTTQPHHVNLRNLPIGTSLDYAVVKAREATDVTGELAIVDEVGKAVTYNGWEQRKGQLQTRSGVYYPYGGSVHVANLGGQLMDVAFVGSSISVYGMFPATNGTLFATYTLDDGSPQPRTYSGSSSSSASPNYLLFTQTGLSPGFHTLSVKVIDNTSNDFLVVDYMTYHPTFGSIDRLRSSEASLNEEAARAARPQMAKGTVAGMVVGVVLVVALLIVGACMRQSCIRWARGTFTMRRRTRGKGTDSEKGDGDLAADPWSSQSPHYAFVDPNRSESGLTDTVSTLPVKSQP